MNRNYTKFIIDKINKKYKEFKEIKSNNNIVDDMYEKEEKKINYKISPKINQAINRKIN